MCVCLCSVSLLVHMMVAFRKSITGGDRHNQCLTKWGGGGGDNHYLLKYRGHNPKYGDNNKSK